MPTVGGGEGGGPALTMWCLVFDKLLRLLSDAGFFTRTYAYDVIVAIIPDDQGTAVDLMSIVKKWC